MTMMTYQQALDEALKDHVFRREYRALESEYQERRQQLLKNYLLRKGYSERREEDKELTAEWEPTVGDGIEDEEWDCQP